MMEEQMKFLKEQKEAEEKELRELREKMVLMSKEGAAENQKRMEEE